MVEAGGVGIQGLIENTLLIDFSRRQKRRTRQIAPNWNISGKRDFFTSVANEIGLSDTKARPKRSNLEVGFNLEGSWAARDWF
jgi:hypothetical protein